MRQLIEKSLEFNLAATFCFIDFKAASDSIDRDVLWMLLNHYGLPVKIINIIKNSYEYSKSCVEAENSEWFEIKTGVKQGCVWSPLLFGLVIDWIMSDMGDKGIETEPKVGSRRPGWKLPDLDFADDIALIESVLNELEDKKQHDSSNQRV